MSAPVSTRTFVPLRQALLGGLVGLLAFAALAALTRPAEARGFDSRYSRFDYQHCPEAASPEPGVIEVRRCPGLPRFDIMWTAEPDSSEVGFGQTIDSGPLGLGAFFEADDTIEWRLRNRLGQSTPIAAIVRYAYGDSVGSLGKSRLVVYRLEPSGRSCVLGSIDGKRTNANAEARQLADRWAGSFVCGRSARR